MGNENFIMIDLNDSRTKEISEVIGNKTCKRIISFLSETSNASEKDISDKLSIPINTVEYNLNKLIKAGLVEKTKIFFWSVKGKRIPMYKLSNKKIVISPKSFTREILPSLIAVLIGSFGIKVFMDRINSQEIGLVQNSFFQESAPTLQKAVLDNGGKLVSSALSSCSFFNEAPLWFLLGGLFSILFFLLYDYFKKRMKGGF